MKTKIKPIKIKVIEVVPWQICPKCNGFGQVNVTYNPGFTFYGYVCDVCQGSKIIPMCKIS
jgi:DnaJ-class molecular chaperone